MILKDGPTLRSETAISDVIVFARCRRLFVLFSCAICKGAKKPSVRSIRLAEKGQFVDGETLMPSDTIL